jgi:hypothetical protein
MDALVFEADFQVWSVPIYKPFRLEWLSRRELASLLDRARAGG